VWIPKYRRRALFGEYRVEMGRILRKVCELEGIEVIKAATQIDHVHMYVSIPPKLPVSKVVGRVKGKSTLMFFDRYPELRRKYQRRFWARGYYCETVGNVNEETIKKYIDEQYKRDQIDDDGADVKKA
jgi:putative transposase